MDHTAFPTQIQQKTEKVSYLNNGEWKGAPPFHDNNK